MLSILSTSTITGRAFTVPSAMAKSAILAMTKSLAVEWGPKGIRTVAIAPGAFPTPGASGQLRPEGRDESWASRNPLGRVGEHRELADLASFLISDPCRLHQWRDGGAGWRRSFAQFRRGGSAAMDRCAVGEPARDAAEKPERQTERANSRAVRETRSQRCASCLPKSAFPGYPIARVATKGRSHLPVTIMREPILVMSLRRILTALAVSAMLCGARALRRRRCSPAAFAEDCQRPRPGRRRQSQRRSNRKPSPRQPLPAASRR